MPVMGASPTVECAYGVEVFPPSNLVAPVSTPMLSILILFVYISSRLTDIISKVKRGTRRSLGSQTKARFELQVRQPVLPCTSRPSATELSLLSSWLCSTSTVQFPGRLAPLFLVADLCNGYRDRVVPCLRPILRCSRGYSPF